MLDSSQRYCDHVFSGLGSIALVNFLRLLLPVVDSSVMGQNSLQLPLCSDSLDFCDSTSCPFYSVAVAHAMTKTNLGEGSLYFHLHLQVTVPSLREVEVGSLIQSQGLSG